MTKSPRASVQGQLPFLKTRIVGVLEDEPKIAKRVSAVLRMFGFRGLHVRSREEVVALLRDRGVSVFILDIQIGAKREGLDALEDLKDLDPNVFVCIYSGHMDSPQNLRKAQRLNADAIQEKSGNPRRDLCLIAREVLRHERLINALELELLELELAGTADARPGPINWQSGLVQAPGDREVLGEIAEPGGGVDGIDVNERLFERLSTDPAWFAAHLGKVVGIVDGIVVSVGSVMDDVIKEMRAACPGRSRFVKTVEEQDEVFDIPSPCDIIES